MMKLNLSLFPVLVIALLWPFAAWSQNQDKQSAFEIRHNLLIKQYDDVFDHEWDDNPNIIVRKNGKCGVVNSDNRLFIPLQYDSIINQGRFFIVVKDRLMGVISDEGKQVVPIEYADINFCADREQACFIVAKYDPECMEKTGNDLTACDAKYGLLDPDGNVILPLAPVCIESMYIYDYDITPQGRISISDLGNNAFGVIGLDGHMVLPMEYQQVQIIPFSDRIVVKKDEKYALVDWQGNVVIPLEFDDMVFDEYGISVATGNKQGKNKPMKYAFWNLNGVKQCDAVFTNVEQGIFGTYDATIGKQKYTIYAYSDGLAPFTDQETFNSDQNPVWGYLDAHGQVAIKPQFNTANCFSEGLAAVALYDAVDEGLKYGFIDTNGNVVIPAVYNNASYFNEGLAVVSTPDEHLVINKKGQTVKAFDDFDDLCIIRDNNGQILIEKIISDSEKMYYNIQGELVKMVIDGKTWSPNP